MILVFRCEIDNGLFGDWLAPSVVSSQFPDDSGDGVQFIHFGRRISD